MAKQFPKSAYVPDVLSRGLGPEDTAAYVSQQQRWARGCLSGLPRAFRAKLPIGKGVWPALWMLPQDEKYSGWPASGEIDIVEAKGQEPNKVLGTLHYGSRWPMNVHSGKDYVFPDKGTIADFHVYTLEWEPGEMRWAVDGKTYQTQSFWWSTSKIAGNKGAMGSSVRVYEAGSDKLLWFEELSLRAKQVQLNSYGFAETERHFGLGDRTTVDVDPISVT